MAMVNEAERVLDATGWELLCALQENARSSYADLGKRVGLTPPAVGDRIRRLEAARIITGYHATVNPAKLGLGLTAIIRFKSSGEPFERIVAVIKACPEIIECRDVTGDDCMTLTAVVSSVEQLQDVIGRLLPYGSAQTITILSPPLYHHTHRPPAASHRLSHAI